MAFEQRQRGRFDLPRLGLETLTPQTRRVGCQGSTWKGENKEGKQIEPPFGARKCSFKRDGPVAFGSLQGAMKEGEDLEGEHKSLET